MSDLIDTTEMYLRTVFELEEEGVVPLRARIAERLGQSGPTVSQTVARMERDGLLTVSGDRHLELTARGREYATQVMRKHRIAECMLVGILEMPLEEVHAEACRWEHVMSESVERRILEMLGSPTESPFGNPIPGLDALLPGFALPLQETTAWVPLDSIGTEGTVRVTVRRIGEPAQAEADTVRLLNRAGVVAGAAVRVQRSAGGVMVGSAGEYVELPPEVAAHVIVQPLG
ncbi:MAG: iron dependent repressor, metal binding and dimerization domain protein [Candidatus Nanopelagicales bacterium]